MRYIVISIDTNVNCWKGGLVASADLLLHPVRLRIVQAFLGRRALTTGALHAHLADIPVATLYRQINTLVDGGVLEVTGERKVRGAVERTFTLRVAAAHVSAEDAADMSVDDHRRAFRTFVAGLLGDFDRYLQQGEIDLVRDFVGYRRAAAYLSDDEMQELLGELRAVIEPRLDNDAGPGRRRRIINSILMPGDAPGEEEIGRADRI